MGLKNPFEYKTKTVKAPKGWKVSDAKISTTGLVRISYYRRKKVKK